MGRKASERAFKLKDSPSNRELLKQHYECGKPLSLAEVSELTGQPRSTIHAIELRALAKLKKALAKYGIKRIDDVLDVSRDRAAADNGASIDGHWN